jgi:hypothetical protein
MWKVHDDAWVCKSMDTIIIGHESTSMYMEKNAELKTLGLYP